MSKQYLQALLAEARGITAKAEEEKRALTAEERSKIDEIKATIASAKDLPEIPEAATPEGRAMPEPGKKEFRAAITTTGSAVLDGQQSGGVWDKVVQTNPIRGMARLLWGKANLAVAIPGTITFATTSPAADGSMSYTGKTLTAKRYAAKIPVSNDLLEDAAYDIESDLNYNVAKYWGKKELLEILQGGGTADIAGVIGTLDAGHKNVVASPSVATIVGNLQTTLIKLDTAFRTSAVAFVSAATQALLLQNLDQNKQIQLVNGELTVSGLKVYGVDGLTAAHAVIGDFSQLALLTVREIEVKKLVEVDALAGNTVFLAGVRVDAGVMDAGAFAALVAS